MKTAFLYALVLVSTCFAQAQNFEWLDSQTVKLNSIEPADTDFSDLETLGVLLEGKRLVLLGEQEHGDGSAFSAKIRIIKYLHQKLGFDVIAFETGFYSTPYNWNLYRNGKQSLEQSVHNSMLKQWADPEEMQPLYRYIADSNLVLTGFDNYDHDPAMLAEYKIKIDSIEKANNLQRNFIFKKVLTDLSAKGMYSNPSADNKTSFYQHLDSLIDTMNKNQGEHETGFWIQELKGLKAQAAGWWQRDGHTRENWWSSQNIRDAQMADNIIWLLNKKYPNRKIIVWAANYHIARNVSTHVKKDRYFQNERAVSMGEYLFDSIGVDLYAFGICSYAGNRAVTDHLPYQSYSIRPRSKETVEHYLHSKGYPYAFVNFSAVRPRGKQFKMAGLSHYELTGDWTNVFDGIIFIDTMKAPKYR